MAAPRAGRAAPSWALVLGLALCSGPGAAASSSSSSAAAASKGTCGCSAGRGSGGEAAAAAAWRYSPEANAPSPAVGPGTRKGPAAHSQVGETYSCPWRGAWALRIVVWDGRCLVSGWVVKAISVIYLFDFSRTAVFRCERSFSM